MALRGLSRRTRDSYIASIRRYLVWQKSNWDTVKDENHERRMERFLTEIVTDKSRPISFSTQHQYFNAILYFYREYQSKPISKIRAPKAPRHQKIFTLPSTGQIKSLFVGLPTQPSNMSFIAKLIYGTGMRIDEALSLRVKDILFEEKLIAVQEGKGDKPRLVDMPTSLIPEIKDQIQYAKSQYDEDRALKRNGVYLPNSLEIKYPAYATSWEWYWVIPHYQEGWDPESNIKRRYHVYDFDVQKAFRETRRKLKLPETFTPHVLRHAYATHYLKHLLSETKKAGVEIPDIFAFCRDVLKKKLGHVSPQTTNTYIHLATERSNLIDKSPLDILTSAV